MEAFKDTLHILKQEKRCFFYFTKFEQILAFNQKIK